MNSKFSAKILTLLMPIALSSFLATDGLLGQVDAPKVKKEKIETPEVEVVEIQSKDGVLLKCLWYGGTNEKETIPVIMLHEWGGNREQMAEYARSLQEKKGHAVIVPDLRGHGESTNTRFGDKLELDKFRPDQIAAAVADIEACKKFLVKKNNDGELNIDLLTVVAEGVSCIHAVKWAVGDWQYSYFGGIKQGSDVKSLILMGAPKSYRGIKLTQDVKNGIFTGSPKQSLSMMFLGDADAGEKSVRETKSIYQGMKRLRDADDEEDAFIYFYEYLTKKQVKVVKNEEGQELAFADFLGFYVDKQNERFKDAYRWQDRSRE